jgi:predicted transcriptional regulator
MSISLTDREADVMRVLWDHGPSIANDVRGRLNDLSDQKLSPEQIRRMRKVLDLKSRKEKP